MTTITMQDQERLETLRKEYVGKVHRNWTINNLHLKK